MQNSEMKSENPMTSNMPGAMNTPFNNQIMSQTPYCQMEMADMVACRMIYPEIFYKVQPYIMVVCDQMDTYGNTMPTQEMLEQMSDNICDDVCHMYPDLADYATNCEKRANADAVDTEVIARGPGFFGRRPRRRGLLRDLVDILLLSEFYRRRRRVY